MANAQKYRNELVNSSKAQAPSFSKSEVQYGRRFAGCVVIPEADFMKISKKPPERWDLYLQQLPDKSYKTNAQIGSATLIDYNYVLMCLHTYNSVINFQDNKKVMVIFHNEITASTADLPGPQRVAESNRPFCYLRGDLEAHVGTNKDPDNEDFAIVKIEWNSPSDFETVVKGISGKQKLPKFTGPTENLSGKVNTTKEVSYIQQYTHEIEIKSDLWTHMSTHFAWGVVEKIDQRPANKAMSIYALTYITSIVGASGSPVYNDKMEVVGIVVGNQSAYTAFLPIEKIYQCTFKSTDKYYIGYLNKSGSEILTDIYNYRKKNENW